jgi:hypothetical protein
MFQTIHNQDHYLTFHSSHEFSNCSSKNQANFNNQQFLNQLNLDLHATKLFESVRSK